MSAIQRTMLSAVTQLMAKAPTAVLNVGTRQVAIAALMATASFAATAQQYPQQGPDLLPQQSASRWGQMLGGVVGQGVASSLGIQNRDLSRVVSGVAYEVGRNAGGVAATSGYDSRTNNQSRNQVVPMQVVQADHLDTQAMRAVIAHERAELVMSQQGRNSPAMRDAEYSFRDALRTLENSMRVAEQNRNDVSPWKQLQSALAAPIGSVSPAYIAQLSQPSLSRLQRPGGPGLQAFQQQLERQGSLPPGLIPQQYQQPQSATVREYRDQATNARGEGWNQSNGNNYPRY